MDGFESAGFEAPAGEPARSDRYEAPDGGAAWEGAGSARPAPPVVGEPPEAPPQPAAGTTAPPGAGAPAGAASASAGLGLARAIIEQIRKRVVGQELLVERLLVGLLADGHVLLEGVPGLAKTLTVSSLAEAIHADFQRIQFTPDLLPADVVGTMIYNQGTGTFTPNRGPIFANIVLADEINRAPPKVQSALLEAMQERQVTLGGETHPLDPPFLVLATQNPIEQEGTYPLPEAQVDRFMLKLVVRYPSRDEEKEIIRLMAGREPAAIQAVAGPEDVFAARREVADVYMDEKITDYIVDVVRSTRHPDEFGASELRPLVHFGASPRASIYLAQCTRALAFLRGRDYVLPEDVKELAPDVLRHRVITTFEAEAEEVSADDIVRRLLEVVRVP
ncbi:MAG TPA: MoxR family ATPase [Longimicrobiales bacterium]|nr:MoxR family ATPase [Longimicrobiales bacterium]